ncbi:MAG: M14 family metallopeptidase [Longimicrobiales bacterium]
MDLPRHRHTTRRRLGRTTVLAACLLLGVVQLAEAQEVKIDFNDYHGYDGTVDYLEDVADAYPNITELLQIGESNMGRPVYVLVISNRRTGTTIDQHVELRNERKEGVENVTPMKPYQGKPGMWIDGGTHGNEYTGTEVTLYIIDKLVSGYGSDESLTRLIDENAFYVCPIVNPDGVYNSVDRGISQRQNSMEQDDDGDGRINEDGPDDLNGDGLITSFRYPDPEGRYVQDPSDPRIMIRLGRGEEPEPGRERWSVIPEGRDNDGDGRSGEDSERGIDVNRNFPEGWFRDDNTQGGSGFYAASSPESHAILEFFTNHTNILLVQSFHTSGGFTYRPFARWPDTEIDAKDLGVFDGILAPKYKELHGEDADDSLWRHPYNDEEGRPYGFGIFIDWAYAQFGAYSMTTELWNWRRDTRGLPGYAGEEEIEVWYRALLENGASVTDETLFVPWRSFDHPEHGQGEVGGFVSKYVGGNALPGESLLHVADIHWQFELFKAGLLPRLEITDAAAEVLTTADDGTRVVKVTATVRNDGALATHVARGAQLAGNREDALWLIGDRDRIKFLQGSAWQSLGILEGTTEIPGYTPGPAASTPTQGGGFFRQEDPPEAHVEGTGNTRTVTWLVSMEGSVPLKLVLTSQKGGTRVQNLTVR